MVLGSVLVLSSTEVIAQSCPTFETKEIINSTEGLANGQAKFIIKGTKFYNEQNFEIRQKEHGVTGPLGFDIELKLVGNELTVSKLKRSEELFLKEYVIRFSDKSCDNAKIVEVDTFKIN